MINTILLLLMMVATARTRANYRLGCENEIRPRVLINSEIISRAAFSFKEIAHVRSVCVPRYEFVHEFKATRFFELPAVISFLVYAQIDGPPSLRRTFRSLSRSSHVKQEHRTKHCEFQHGLA